MGHIIEPLVLGKRAGLSPFSMVAAASFWTLLWGPAGLLLAAPITMAIVVLGRYVPGLEFLSILLGDDPPLRPDQEFYQRILSGDALAAAAQIEASIEASPIAEAADQIVMPSLQLASADQRRGRLDSDQIDALRQTMCHVTELIADTQPAREAPRGSTQVLIVPARGMIDAAAACFVADIAQLTTSHVVTTSRSGSGLTAIADASVQARRSGSEASIDTFIIVTAGGIQRHHLPFVVRRALREFPQTRLLVLDWGSRDSQVAGFERQATVCGSVVDVLSRLECVSAADAVPDIVNHPRTSLTEPFRDGISKTAMTAAADSIETSGG